MHVIVAGRGIREGEPEQAVVTPVFLDCDMSGTMLKVMLRLSSV